MTHTILTHLQAPLSGGCAAARAAAAGKFPVFPVETGILSIFPDLRCFDHENGQPNQALAGQFP
jgi:hypothetical protein